jgi:histidinol-phosphatase (PHP family)
MIVDYHMHLRGPNEPGVEGAIEHSVEAVERFVETATARGVDEIGFAEHMYYFRELERLVEHPYQRSRIAHGLEAYVDAVIEAKSRSLPVKLGLEIDHIPGRVEELAALLAPYPWDYLLGSVHVVDGEAIDMEPGLWARLPVEEVWRLYFEALGELARSGLVDVLAHPDLVKIFGMRPSAEEVSLRYEMCAETVAAAGVTVEVSTAGLRKRVGEIYPAPELLGLFHASGVPVTLASDAHVYHDVGRDFDRALELLQDAGYETVTVFEGRRGRQEPLG